MSGIQTPRMKFIKAVQFLYHFLTQSQVMVIRPKTNLLGEMKRQQGEVAQVEA